MFTDILTVLRKEWREIFLMRGSVRSGVTNVLILVGVIGIVMPWQSGPEWLTSPVGAMIWAWLPIFSSTGIIADSVAGERERHTLETLLASRLNDRAILLGKISATVLYAWMLSVVSMLVGVVTVNVAYPSGQLQFYSASFFFPVLLLTLLLGLLLAVIGVLVSLNAENARQAYQKMSIVMIVVWVLPALAVQFIPQATLANALRFLDSVSLPALAGGFFAVVLAADFILLRLAIARFKRSRLILA